MGWKAVKDDFKIEHAVHLAEGLLHVGGNGHSPHILSYDHLGNVVHGHGEVSMLVFGRYLADIARERPKFAEEPEWPGVTHDGRLIMRGNFSTSKQEVLEYAQASLTRYEQALVHHKAELEEKLHYTQERLAMVRSNLTKLQNQP